MGTGVQKGYPGLGYEHTFQKQAEFISGKKFNQILTVIEQVGCDSPLQILTSFYIYKHLSSLKIMVDQEGK